MESNTPVENRENPLFGRKVFFVNPPLIVENLIIAELREDEYEVYLIDDYHYTKAVLENNKDAMVFVYVDDDLTYDQWFNYIKSYEVDEKLNSIFIGVLSSKMGITDRQRFMMDLKLPGGFIMLNENIYMTQKKIKDILDLNGAKGRRKYIRLDCKNLSSVNGYFAAKDRLYTFSIDNISSVGFACVYPAEITGLFLKNSVLPSVSLTLGRKTIIASSVVFDTRIVNNKGFSVLLFNKDVSKETRVAIRNFIFDTLDENFNNIVKNSISDLTDYSQKIVTDKDSDIPEFEDIQDSFIEMLDEFLPELPVDLQ